MGGNIRDPLNLKSVKPEDPNCHRIFSKPIEVIVPKNLNDPLNLQNMPRLETSASSRKRLLFLYLSLVYQFQNFFIIKLIF